LYGVKTENGLPTRVRNRLRRPAVAHDHSATPALQRSVESAQRFVDEMYAAVALRRQHIKNLVAEDKGAIDLPHLGQGHAQDSMVMVAQVAGNQASAFSIFMVGLYPGDD